MSDSTGESTYFTGGDGCHGRSGCAACGARDYSMRADGPRCNGCGRFVTKDESANYDKIVGAGAWGDALDAAMTEGNPGATGDDMLGLRGRLTGDLTATGGDGQLTISKLDELMGEVPHSPPYSGRMPGGTPASTPAPAYKAPEMTEETVMAGVMAILKEAKASE